MKRILFPLFLLTSVLLLPTYASAAGVLSPGLSQIAGNCEMVASGLVSGDIRFSEADFANAVGCPIRTITVTALPPASDGMLFYGNAPVAQGQRIAAKSLSKLRFTPSENTESSSFRFKADGEYSIACLLRWTDQANAAPVAGRNAPDAPDDALSCWTQCDIAAYNSLSGYDPDGDAVIFEITDYPENGYLELLSSASGDYRYTPFDGVRGTDSFTYTVRDEWGHYSAPCTVTVTVDKAASDIELADMEGHWAHNAALVMASENAMDVRFVDGKLLFEPDGVVTREDFLKTVMKALGSGNIPAAKTVFADDAEISSSASGYVARAYSLGIIKGSAEDGELYFRPKDSITRAEAAVILNNIIGAEDSDAVAVFADSQSVPAWAKSSLSALTSAGVFRGTGSGQISPNTELNRAQVAEILMKVRQIYG